MLKLFMFYVGGSFAKSNVELHDVRFSVGATAEDCHEDLRRQWWGTPQSLHLDCWGPIDHADGHDVAIGERDATETADKLFFVNLGGYDPKEFAELHRNVLLVAPDAATAKTRALRLITPWSEPHRDQLFEIEQMVDLSADLATRGLGLRLTKSAEEKPFRFECHYLPIGRK